MPSNISGYEVHIKHKCPGVKDESDILITVKEDMLREQAHRIALDKKIGTCIIQNPECGGEAYTYRVDYSIPLSNM